MWNGAVAVTTQDGQFGTQYAVEDITISKATPYNIWRPTGESYRTAKATLLAKRWTYKGVRDSFTGVTTYSFQSERIDYTTGRQKPRRQDQHAHVGPV